MRIDFRQGIISCPTTGSIQQFLTYSGGYVSFTAANGKTDIAFAHGTENYLLSETVDVSNAWGPFASGTDYWLYWDIDSRTGVRSHGSTPLAPIVSTIQPALTEGQHWFNPVTTTMYVCVSGGYRAVIRAFAARVNSGAFSPLGINTNNPYTGTQVGIVASNTRVGQILFDDTGRPLRRIDGRFFTSENELFVSNSSFNSIKLDTAFVAATAVANMSKYSVVVFTSFGTINLASYADIGTKAIAILLEDLQVGQTGAVATQGKITNPSWGWANLTKLWVSEAGVLTPNDPHVSNPIAYPVQKPPICLVIDTDTILFDQTIGGIIQSTESVLPSVMPATTTSLGVVQLSVGAAVVDAPIVVGDNDPRMIDARVPLPHTQPASTITITPYGSLTASTAQGAIEQLEDAKVNKVGDTMSGHLILSGTPVQPLHATTKQYVDAGLDTKSDIGHNHDDSYVNVSGDTMMGNLTLASDPDEPMHAATKHYVDTHAGGGGAVESSIYLHGCAPDILLDNTASENFVKGVGLLPDVPTFTGAIVVDTTDVPAFQRHVASTTGYNPPLILAVSVSNSAQVGVYGPSYISNSPAMYVWFGDYHTTGTCIASPLAGHVAVNPVGSGIPIGRHQNIGNDRNAIIIRSTYESPSWVQVEVHDISLGDKESSLHTYITIPPGTYDFVMEAYDESLTMYNSTLYSVEILSSPLTVQQLIDIINQTMQNQYFSGCVSVRAGWSFNNTIVFMDANRELGYQNIFHIQRGADTPTSLFTAIVANNPHIVIQTLATVDATGLTETGGPMTIPETLPNSQGLSWGIKVSPSQVLNEAGYD